MRRLIVIIFLIAGIGRVNAQYVRQDSIHAPASHAPLPYNFEDHLSIGGNLGLQLGYFTLIGLSPLINYHFNSNFVMGIGPIYQYTSFNEAGYVPYTTSIYGGRVVAQCFLPGKLSNAFVMGEYDIVNVPYYDIFGNFGRTTIDVPLIGGGYRQPISSKSCFQLIVLFDLSNSQLSPYSNPVILTGFDFGL
jgi:hypothetical protein